MSTTTTAATCDAFVAAAREYGLLTGPALEQANVFVEQFPRRGTEDLSSHLVEQGALSRFQADALLAGNGKNLVLSLYTLVDVIGSGSMGTVYRARSARDDNSYAVKIVPRRNVINLKSIGEKVAALKQVRHPRVSAMVHIGAQGDRVYLVWPLLEGGEKLGDLVARQGPLLPRQTAQVALQVASGLQAYHALGLYHGLLKPSDILIGADRRVRLLDFGVGFLLTCDGGKALLDTTTNTKALARGLDCASPESIMDPLDRSIWGDQYSLGCILYFCLTGQYPFPASNPVKKMMGHQFEEPAALLEMAPETPAKLAEIVHRLLRKTPGERYASTDEVVAELQKVTSDSRIAVAAPKPTPAAGSPTTPSRRLAEKPAVQTEPVTAPRGDWFIVVGVAAGVAAGLFAWFLMRH